MTDVVAEEVDEGRELLKKLYEGGVREWSAWARRILPYSNLLTCAPVHQLDGEDDGEDDDFEGLPEDEDELDDEDDEEDEDEEDEDEGTSESHWSSTAGPPLTTIPSPQKRTRRTKTRRRAETRMVRVLVVACVHTLPSIHATPTRSFHAAAAPALGKRKKDGDDDDEEEGDEEDDSPSKKRKA